MLVGDEATPVAWTVQNEPQAIRRLARKLEREAPGPVMCCYEAGPCAVGTRSPRGSAKSMDFAERRERLPGTLENRTVANMSPLGARVEKGRLVLDEPTTLPDGTVVDLVADDEGADLTDEEPRALPSTTPSIADAFRTTLDLFDTGLDLMRQNLRRRHPEAADEEIERLLREWLLVRPGADAGDCPGRPVDVNARLA